MNTVPFTARGRGGGGFSLNGSYDATFGFSFQRRNRNARSYATLYTFQHYFEQTAIEEILKFGEFSSLLNKSHSANSTSKSEDVRNAESDSKSKEAFPQEEDETGQHKVKEEDMDKDKDKDKDMDKDMDNRSCQVENGQDIV